MPTDSRPGPDIEQLKREFARLDREKTTAEADLKNANEQLDLLKTEAREKFQTDDVDALKRKLAQMHAENEARRVEYQKHLDEINAKLAAVEQQFGRGTGSEPK